jgi:hypothetical protein
VFVRAEPPKVVDQRGQQGPRRQFASLAQGFDQTSFSELLSFSIEGFSHAISEESQGISR